jgi:hypothetical protein
VGVSVFAANRVMEVPPLEAICLMFIANSIKKFPIYEIVCYIPRPLLEKVIGYLPFSGLVYLENVHFAEEFYFYWKCMSRVNLALDKQWRKQAALLGLGDPAFCKNATRKDIRRKLTLRMEQIRTSERTIFKGYETQDIHMVLKHGILRRRDNPLPYPYYCNIRDRNAFPIRQNKDVYMTKELCNNITM